MIVYVIDERVPRAPPPDSLAALVRHDNDTLEEGWQRVINAFPGHGDAQLIMVNDNMSIREIVDAVIARVQTPRTIWLMRIVAHGFPGEIFLGRRLNVTELRHFRRLDNYMTSTGRGVEIHSCEVARNRPGRRLLQRMANLVRMPVKASLVTQRADNRFRFEGETVVLQPRSPLGALTDD